MSLSLFSLNSLNYISIADDFFPHSGHRTAVTVINHTYHVANMSLLFNISIPYPIRQHFMITRYYYVVVVLPILLIDDIISE